MIAVCGVRPSESQDEVVREVRAMGGDAIALSGDVGNIDVPEGLVDAAVSEFGGLDVLVANSAIASPGSLGGLSIGEWERMFAVNLRGPWLLAATAPETCRP